MKVILNKIVFVKKMAMLFALLLIVSSVSTANAQEEVSCGMPTFDRSENQGLFIWQQCSTNEWFLRVSAGGLPSGVGAEFNVIGTLSVSEPVFDLVEFSIEPNDTLDISDLTNIEFNLRAFTSSQDGFDFKIEEGAIGCLKLSSPQNLEIVIGSQNTTAKTPLDLETLAKSIDCNNSSAIIPTVSLLLED